MELRLSPSRQHSSAHPRKRWDAVKGNDTSQCKTLCPTDKIPQDSSEYSAQNAWNWNNNNQNWNNNNKNNNNSVCAVRDSVEPQDGVVTLQDLYTAYEDCRHRKKRKKGAKAFDPYALHILCSIRDELNQRRYRLKPSQCFVIKYPVRREVFCASFRDRVVQHFVYNELNPVIEKLLIRDTASCRLEKGTDYAIHRVQTFLRREMENYKKTDGVYIAKFDLSGFFMSIDRKALLKKILWVVDNRYKGKYKAVLHYLLPIIILSDVSKNAIRLSPLKEWESLPSHKSLFGNDKGLPIGNITSQLFANYYLNDIDHMIKSRHKSYARYVDDMVVIDRSKAELEETRAMISAMLSENNMRLNERKSTISDAKYGVSFLGIRIKPYYSILSKQRINRLWFSSRKFANATEAFASCASRKGMFNRYHGKRISERWYLSLQSDIRKNLKMDSNAKFYLVGKRALLDKNKLRNICMFAD